MTIRKTLIGLTILAAVAAGDQARAHDHGDDADVATTLAPVPAAADERCGCRHDRQGFFLGVNTGIGSGQLGFEDKLTGQDHDDDAGEGGFGGLRAGFALSNSVALGVEGQSWHRTRHDQESSAGALVGTVTWWPSGGGFFLRAGAGYGGVDLEEQHADGTVRKLEDDGFAGLLGLGYEWRVSRSFALGLALDAFLVDLEDTVRFENVGFGAGAFSIQLQWYL